MEPTKDELQQQLEDMRRANAVLLKDLRDVSIAYMSCRLTNLAESNRELEARVNKAQSMVDKLIHDFSEFRLAIETECKNYRTEMHGRVTDASKQFSKLTERVITLEGNGQ